MPPTTRRARADLSPPPALELVPARGRLAPQRRVLAKIERTSDDVVVELVVLDEDRAFVDVLRQRHGAGVDSVRLRPRDLRTVVAALLEAQTLLDVGDRPAKPARSR